jgi:hypothetical protein
MGQPTVKRTSSFIITIIIIIYILRVKYIYISIMHDAWLCKTCMTYPISHPYSGAIWRVIHDQTYITCYVKPRPISPLIITL